MHDGAGLVRGQSTALRSSVPCRVLPVRRLDGKSIGTENAYYARGGVVWCEDGQTECGPERGTRGPAEAPSAH